MSSFYEGVVNFGKDVSKAFWAASKLGADIAIGAGAVEATQTIVDNWLALNYTKAGQAAHVAATLASSALLNSMSSLYYQPGAINGALDRVLTSATGDVQSTTLNAILATFMQPTIEGVVVVAENETCTRAVDVSEDPLIVQDTLGTRYVTDNAVPKPRHFELTGHIVEMSFLDHFNLIKPSIIAQATLLDNYMKSGRPVMFKRFGMTFVRCLITNFSYSFNPKYNNALDVQLSLVEFMPYYVDTELDGAADAILKKVMEIGK